MVRHICLILNNQFFSLNNNNKLVDIGMRIRSKIITDLQSNKLKDVDVFQYFFKNPLMPTEEEWNNMAYLIKFFICFCFLNLIRHHHHQKNMAQQQKKSNVLPGKENQLFKSIIVSYFLVRFQFELVVIAKL